MIKISFQSISLVTLWLATMFSSHILVGQNISSRSILEKSIAYHDPLGQLNKYPLELKMKQTRPNGEDRHTTVFVALQGNEFASTNKVGENTISMNNKKGTVEFSVNGNQAPTPEQIEEFSLTKERFERMHNYYRYLWFAPLILNDPGTILEPTPESTYFNGKKVWGIKVTYDPSVGEDIWYFYFDQNSYALTGYRFYHDEEKNDGEYIILEGEVERDQIRIPASRKWYMHQDDKYLGNDILTDFEIVK